MWRRLSTTLALAYLAALAVIAALIQRWADSWSLATVLVFAPRWIWLAPLVPLTAAAAGWRQWRLLGVLAVAGAVSLFAILDLRIPPPGRGGARPRIRVMTANLGGPLTPVPVEAIAEALRADEVDVAAFQECRTDLQPLRAQGWYTVNSYALCLLSRFPVTAAEARDPHDMWKMDGAGLMARYELRGPSGPIHLVSVHLETARPALAVALHRPWRAGPALRENMGQRRFESRLARGYVDATPAPVIVVGDFNLPVESAIYREFWSPFANAFSACGLGFGDTKLTSWHGVRIDHILLGPGWRCQSAWPGRGVAPGNDHRPLIAEIE
jgi:vancomycin resistance protein VanJ